MRTSQSGMFEKILGAFIVLIPVLVSVKTGDLNYLWSEFAFVIFAIVIQPSVINKSIDKTGE